MASANSRTTSIRSWRFVMQDKLIRHTPRLARWHDHVNHVHAPREMQHWLTDPGSLTAKLIAHSSQFRVERVFQRSAFCWADDYAAIGLHRAGKVHAREVLLHCDNQPAVFAHTVLSLQANATQWPLIRSLGNRSLGSTLFGDPQVVRGVMQYARLHANHPAMRRARTLTCHAAEPEHLHPSNGHLFARRSLFYRRGGVMLVTEMFLPTVAQLTRQE